MTATSTTSSPAPVTSGGSASARRALAVAGSALAALAVWVLAGALLGVDLRVASSGQVREVGAGAVLASALLSSLAGWALLALLERFSSRARTIWTSIALVVLLASLAGPLLGALTLGGKLALVLMHLAVAAVLVPALRRTSASR